MTMIATAPGKLILTGEYAVLDGAPALVVAVDRRVSARRRTGPHGSSPFLVAVADEIAARLGADHPSAHAAMEIVVDSRSFFLGTTKLGLGSSAAVTVAATALALAAPHDKLPVIDRDAVQTIAAAAHAAAQSARPRTPAAELTRRHRTPSLSDLSAQLAGAPAAGGVRGSGADIASAVHGGVIAFSRGQRPSGVESAAQEGAVTRLRWPSGLTLLPFFTGAAADTTEFVARVNAARVENRAAVEAALAAIAKASRAACQACESRAPEIAANALLAALSLAGAATDQLAAATGLPLVPQCVADARAVLAKLGGTAKTTGAGGGDVAIAVIPGTADVGRARRLLIDVGCQPLDLNVDTAGVDLQPDAL